MKVTLVPRAGALDAARVNDVLADLEATRLDMDQWVVEIGSADITSQAEVFLEPDAIAPVAIDVVMTTADIAFGGPLVLELRRFCEDLAADLDLVAQTAKGRVEVPELFESA